MNISKGYFRHPKTRKLITPGEIFTLDITEVTVCKAKELASVDETNKPLPANCLEGSFKDMPVSKLRDRAKAMGIKVKGLKKAELLNAIEMAEK